MSPAIRTIVCALSLTVVSAPIASAGQRAPQPPWMSKWLRARLSASAVPVLLPTPPSEIGPIRAVPVVESDRDGYYVGFSAVATCGGGSWCAMFYVGGTPADSAPALPARYRHVRLDDGTRALYAKNDCSGAACTGGSLIVERGGVDYELDAHLADDDFALLQHAYHTLRLVR